MQRLRVGQPVSVKTIFAFCLDGKASEYYAMVLERNPKADYFSIIRQFEKRFGFQELQETLQLQFSTARQNYNEELEDWADRVLQLGNKAFRDLPEEYIHNQAILRICQGCLDKDAGQHAANSRPRSVEDVLDRIKWFQHTSKAIFGSQTKTREKVPEEPDYGATEYTSAAVTKKEPKSEVDKQLSSLIDKMNEFINIQKQEVQEMKDNINRLQSQRQNE